MRKKLLITLLCAIAFCIAACVMNMGAQTDTGPTQKEESIPFETTISDTTPETTASAMTEALTQPQEMTSSVEETTAAVTEPEHSELYIPGLNVEDVILYFNEVCLDAEIINEGDASLLQKWSEPIYYMVDGNPTAEDMEVLDSFAGWLNTLEGFPGIQQTQDPSMGNLWIHFCSREDMLVLMGEQFAGMDGAVTFWYLENEIYNGIICCRTDLEQHLRNSVIREEIYNGLGPIQDTVLRTDSIIYSGYSEPQRLSEIDELVLRLLYHPMMQCGMDAAECAAVIQQLYY